MTEQRLQSVGGRFVESAGGRFETEAGPPFVPIYEFVTTGRVTSHTRNNGDIVCCGTGGGIVIGAPNEDGPGTQLRVGSIAPGYRLTGQTSGFTFNVENFFGCSPTSPANSGCRNKQPHTVSGDIGQISPTGVHFHSGSFYWIVQLHWGIAGEFVTVERLIN